MELVQRFVESSRLSRAEEISDSKVKLEILRRDPLSVYCTIQGSGKEPYIVLIDLKEGIVGHACPDFSRAPPARRYQGQAIGWCKHLGKLLLMLDKSDVDAIYQVVESLRVVKSGKKLPEILEHIKEQATKIDDKEKISLKDQIAQEKETPASDGKLAERIQQELIQHNIADSLIRMERLVDEVKDKYDELQPILFDEYKLLRKRFLDEFWTTTLIKRLEIAALLVRIPSWSERG